MSEFTVNSQYVKCSDSDKNNGSRNKILIELATKFWISIEEYILGSYKRKIIIT